MSIAYAEPATRVEDPSAIFRPTSPATKVAFSALFLVATVGSTTAGVPIKEPLSAIHTADVAGAPSSANRQQPATDAELIRWLHAETGLTWDQVARAFDVSRRTAHLWANGSKVSASNAEAIHAFAALVRKAVGSSPAETRAALLAVGADGLSLIDRFRRAQYNASAAVSGTPLSPAALLGEVVEGTQ